MGIYSRHHWTMKSLRLWNRRIRLLQLLSVVVVAGCAQQERLPPQQTDAVVVPPAQWRLAGDVVLSTPFSEDWLQQFESPQLRQLVEEALTHNHTLKRAQFNRQRARAQTQIAAQQLRPLSQGKLTTARSRTQSSGVAAHSTAHGVELSVSWEADLWQRLSEQQQATAVREQVTVAELKAARISLVAEVVRSWAAAIESKQQIQLSQERLNHYRSAASVIEQRYSSGITDALDLHLARSEVAIAEERLQARQQSYQKTVQALEILLGRYPAAELDLVDSLPVLSESIPAGLPASLLERRPDLEASARRLEAAGLELSVAGKSRLPSLSLTAKGGASSSALNRLLDWDYLVWSLLGNLTQPLFQQEKLRAEERQKWVDQQQSLNQYAELVLRAFHEVEQGLAADHFYRTRSAALAQAAEESRLAAELALSRYRGGLVDILTLLDAQQRAYDRRSAHLQLEATRVDNRIALYLALGGAY